MPVYSDKSLSQRLERAEAAASANFVDTRARLFPESGAEWIEVSGAYAIFDSPESPVTQSFGLGLFDAITESEFDRLESFFLEREAPVLHEVSPLADQDMLSLLSSRGYRPIELTNVMYMSLSGSEFVSSLPFNPRISARVITPDEVDMWAATSAAGWASEAPELADFMFGFGQISARCSGASPLIAELDHRPIATGILFIHEGTAMMAGASTVPEARRQGAQNALLDARLRLAFEHGCKVVAMGALPGSQSQKNAQKNGFNVAYTRIKWQLDRK